MSVPRFYCPPPLPIHGSHALPPDAAHHAAKVLRLRENDPLQLFDGNGNACDGIIGSISGKQVMVDRLRAAPAEQEAPLRIVLAQAMSSSEKMDWIVQKATELGVADIQPVQTQRSVARLSGERAEKRVEHWRSVVVSACEQCGRNTLPQIQPPQDFSHWLAQAGQLDGSKYILLPDGTVSLQQLGRPERQVTLLIGPEGGFSPDEADMARAAGFTPVLLGPRVLRTETAAIAGMVALQTLWGDFSFV